MTTAITQLYLDKAEQKELTDYYTGKIKIPEPYYDRNRNSLDLSIENRKEISEAIFLKNKAFNFLTGFFMFSIPLRDDKKIKFEENKMLELFSLHSVKDLMSQYSHQEKYKNNTVILHQYLSFLPQNPIFDKNIEEAEKSHNLLLSSISE